jgi:1-acyl-sn-glycerol-3-phosphate acyltransferase
VILDIKKIFDANEIKGKSSEEIYKLLVNKLNYNEFDWQRENKVLFKGKKLAEGIERLLYFCPECHEVNSIKLKESSFHCTACGKEYSINQYGEIEGCSQFTETVSWNKWQRTFLSGLIKEGFSFTNPEISLEKVDSRSAGRDKQYVILVFTQEKLIFQYDNGEVKNIHLADLSGVSITFMDVVEFFVGETKYRLVFNPKKHMSVKLFYDLLVLISK